MTAKDKNSDIAALSYEAARDELVKVVTTLEAGSVSLEESMALWERGEALAARCEEWLGAARGKLNAAIEAKSAAAKND
jgi:exodeoxyribonuclease VII small subunit